MIADSEKSSQAASAPAAKVALQSLVVEPQATFEAVKRLGKGAQAHVYQARRLVLPKQATNAAQQELHIEPFEAAPAQQDIALKVFNEGTQYCNSTQLLREVAVHQQFHGHPNIVQLFGFADKTAQVQIPRNIPRDENDQFAVWRKGYETAERQSVMMLEQCKHGDLFDFVQQNGKITDPKLLKFLFIQVCQALNALHTQASLAHLDIKLENILVGADGNLKLCDFGMVESIDDDLVKRQGTEMYMAPEIIDKRHGETYKGVTADIFAMGVLLWILVFGQPPFAEASSRDRNFSILQRNPEAFWRLHPSIRKLTEPVDEDLKLLLTSMLSREIGMGKRPETIDNVLEHTFFSKETELLDAHNNEWVDKSALYAQFIQKLEVIQQAKRGNAAPQNED